MPRFASDTTVPVERSKAEIEQLLIRYRATEFTTGWKQDSAMIGFRLKELFVRFVLPLPNRSESRFHWKTVRGQKKKLTEKQTETAFQQEVRQRWRALHLVVKAKLEAVECGISSLEREFLAFIVLPSDLTIGDWMFAHALPAIRRGEMPLMLKAHTGDVQDAEFETTSTPKE